MTSTPLGRKFPPGVLMQAIVLLLILPLIILNMLGAIVGGIWLVFRGEWALVGFGILYMIVSPFILSLALLPGIAFAAPAVMAAERHPVVGFIVGIPAIVWQFAVIALSCVWSFQASAYHLGEAPFPHILWGYAVALAPWAYMAGKERQSSGPEPDGTAVPVFFAQLGTLSMAVGTAMNPADTSFGRLLVWFLPFTVLGIVLQLIMAALVSAAYRHRY